MSLIKNLFFLLLTISLPLFGARNYPHEEDKPERYAYPATCTFHFEKDDDVINNWREPCAKSFIDPLRKYLKYIPKPYEADCFTCECGERIGYNVYCDGMGYKSNHAWLKYKKPHDNAAGDENTHRILVYFRNQNRPPSYVFGPYVGDACDELCWDGGYFRKWNHKFSHFFRHFLIYCSQNPECDCYWPERDSTALEINDSVYKFLKTYCDSALIDFSFSEYWTAKEFGMDESGRYFRNTYFPNSHGMASSLVTYTFFYSQYHQMLFSVASFIDANSVLRHEDAIDRIYDHLNLIHYDFYDLYIDCLAAHPHPKIHYELGMIKMHMGDIEGALSHIRELMDLAQSEDFPITSEMYCQEGKVYQQMGMFDQAVTSLTKAIQKNPKNKEAYFARAQAYFETGNFEKALNDYLQSEKSNKLSQNLRASIEYNVSLLKGLTIGSVEGATDTTLTLLHSPYGAAQALWTFAQEPVKTTTNFYNSVYDTVQCITEHFNLMGWEYFDGIGEDLKDFYQKYNNLSDAERGYLTGYYMGKYGMDFVLGTAICSGFKGVALLTKAKDANYICNLEAMAISQANKEAIAAQALKYSAIRKVFFKNVKIEWDKQNKHILGKHNYEIGGSIFEHSNAQELLNKFAGKGRPIPGHKIGPGYKEVVNFKEHIGYFVNGSEIKLPTTKGTIHYSKKGAHIVPTHPNSETCN